MSKKTRPDKQIFLFILNVLLLLTIWASVYDSFESNINKVVVYLGTWVRFAIFFSAMALLIIINYNTMDGWCVPKVV